MHTGADRTVSTILKHDNKQTSYKIALLRAINDIALSYPSMGELEQDIAVPIRMLAEFWVAYYWPFVAPDGPIFQGHRARRGAGLTNDMAFRPALTALREEWEHSLGGPGRPSDGFFLMQELRLGRVRTGYPPDLHRAYTRAVRKISDTIVKQPVRYAGPGEHTVFDPPRPLSELRERARPIPGTGADEVCLVVSRALWRSFLRLSLWVEALCIHEWCLFTETVEQAVPGVDRGEVYRLLTDRPHNRRPLSWERNQIDLLIMEGHIFECPWTGNRITTGIYEVDHIIPVAIYPLNELWNLVPADAAANNLKRARLPSAERLAAARPRLARTYELYSYGAELRDVLQHDVRLRFGQLEGASPSPAVIAEEVGRFVQAIGEFRNVERY